MFPFEKTRLWQTAFSPPDNDGEGEARAMLRDRLLSIRERASYLVSVILRDLPGLTVHDVSHLDALWEVASLIAGESYSLNPAEAFVFGCAVLLHDAAMSMAAYPEGLAAIQQTPQWRDIIASLAQAESGDSASTEQYANPPPHIIAQAVPEVLRQLHAIEAERLPLRHWPQSGSQPTYLIQDDDLRGTYGSIIGKIAASHWWPASELRRLPPRVNAGPGVPSQWFIRPIKLACLLRVADAAHIDHRRAPSFLRALLKPSGISALHWAFQGKLGKPSVDNNFIIFTGGPFTIDEAAAWWLCYDMIGIVDEELRSVQGILDSHALPLFAVTAVKGRKSPEAAAEFITTEGWLPVDASLHVSDVPALVAILGGERLYGSDLSVALRELIQNSADAIRAKQLLLDHVSSDDSIRVRLRRDSENQSWLDIEDSGVGMSPAVLTGALLDFGRSFWRTAALRQEFPGLLAKGLRPTGRYGIGFFSIFMLGERVTVTTRRFDSAISDTNTLDFIGGLQTRPILRKPTATEVLARAGTRVSVRLKIAPDESGGLLFRGEVNKKKILARLEDLVAMVAPALDVNVEVEEEATSWSRVIVANDWQSIDPKLIFRRSHDSKGPAQDEDQLAFAARELRDEQTGTLHGRACIDTRELFYSGWGIVTVGGLRAAAVQYIAGILVGEAPTVSRDSAVPTAPAHVLRLWATEQAALIAASRLSQSKKRRAAAITLALGGEIGDLPIATLDDNYITVADLKEYAKTVDEIPVYYGNSIDHDDDDDVTRRQFDRDFVISSEVVLVSRATLSILSIADTKWPECLPNLYNDGQPRTCADALFNAVALAWGAEPEVVSSTHEVGKVDDMPITRRLSILRRSKTGH